jgi:hypothetical protein
VGADCIRDGVSPAAAQGIALKKGSHRSSTVFFSCSVGADCIRDVVPLQLPKESPLQRAPTVEYGHFSVGADCIRDSCLPGSIPRRGQRSVFNWACLVKYPVGISKAYLTGSIVVVVVIVVVIGCFSDSSFFRQLSSLTRLVSPMLSSATGLWSAEMKFWPGPHLRMSAFHTDTFAFPAVLCAPGASARCPIPAPQALI